MHTSVPTVDSVMETDLRMEQSTGKAVKLKHVPEKRIKAVRSGACTHASDAIQSINDIANLPVAIIL